MRRRAGLLSLFLLLPACSGPAAAEDAEPDPIQDAFASRWGTETGSSVGALSDGGRWNVDFCSHSRARVLRVIPGGTVGWTRTPNVLSIQMRGSSDCAQVQRERAVPPSTTHWGRLYFRNDEVDNPNFHPVTYNCCGEIQIVPWSRIGSPAGVLIGPRTGRDGDGRPLGYPYNGWHPGVRGGEGDLRLENGRWYRYEWMLEYLGPRRYRIHPRVYDMDGRLLYDVETFFQVDYRGSGHSLASWYAEGNSFGITDPVLATHFGLGNEGPALSSASLGNWYMADVALSTEGWIGP